MILLKATVFPYDITQALTQGLGLNVEQLALEEVKVLCYPSGGKVDVILPLTTFGTNIQNMKVLVACADGSGADNITVNGATPSGGSAEIVEGSGAALHVLPKQPYGSTFFEVMTGSPTQPPVFTGIWVARNSD